MIAPELASTRWEAPPSHPELLPGHVHVWRARLPLGSSGAAGENLLSKEERDRARRFLHGTDRDRYLRSHQVLRHLLGKYLGRPPVEIEICHGPRGKPSLAGAGPADLRFNLSHSGDIALYAFRLGAEVGIDLERSGRARLDDLASAGFLSPGERRDLSRLEGRSRQDALLRCWTRKEAYIKATGEGMAAPLAEIEVTVTPGTPKLRRRMAAADGARGWDLVDIAVAPGYAACLATEGAGVLSTWEWRWP